MKKYKYISIIVLVVIIGSCKTTRKLGSDASENQKAVSESNYYRVFTEATKHGLIGNYRSAISLYKLCIKEFPEKAAPYYQLSSIFLRAKQFDVAKQYAIKAEKLDDDNVWYKMHLANIYQFENNIDSAIVIYEKVIKLDSDPEMMYNLAILYNQAGRNEEALDILTRIEENFNGSREIYILKHNIYDDEKLYDSAVVQLELLTKYFSEDVNSYGLLAEYLAEIGKTAKAKSIYEDILEKDSTNGLALLSFAEFYIINEKPDSAFIYYGEALCCSDLNWDDKISVIIGFISNRQFMKENSERIFKMVNILSNERKDYRVYASYADIYVNLERYEDALPYLDSALMMEKSNYLLWEQGLMVNYYTNNNEKVVKIGKEAEEYFKDKPNIYLISAFANREIGKNEDAKKNVSNALKLELDKQSKVQAYNILADIYRDEELYSKSDSCYEMILEIDNENLMIRNNYGYYLSVRKENLKRAEELSKLTILREPNNATYLDTYGWIMFQMGKVREAKNYIEAAIRNGAHNNAEVLDHYGEIMLEMGRCNEAMEAWERIVEIDSTYSIKHKIDSIKVDCH